MASGDSIWGLIFILGVAYCVHNEQEEDKAKELNLRYEEGVRAGYRQGHYEGQRSICDTLESEPYECP
jgi:hypothetical protein